MLRHLPEYGDNFPVLPGLWDPTVPWRFPKHAVRLKSTSVFNQSLLWIMLGLGITVGILWVSWRLSGLTQPEAPVVGEQETAVPEQAGQVVPSSEAPSSREPVEVAPRKRPMETRSRLA